MTCTIDEMLEKLDVEFVESNRYRATSFSGGRGVADASQVLAQLVVAVSRQEPSKKVRSIHMVFVRMIAEDEPISLEVNPVHSGRTLASFDVRAVQGEKIRAHGIVWMDSDEPDFITHSDSMPQVPGPDDSTPLPMGVEGRDLRLTEKVDLMDPEEIGPPDLNVWLRYERSSSESAINQGLIAHISNHFSIAAAMRPHEGVALSQAHKTVSTGILALDVTFHREANPGEWLLVNHHSPDAGRGLSLGQGRIFTQSGELVASFSQESMIKGMAKKASGGKEML